MTYSIVARDARSGEIGVAVETCMFAVGSVVPWARAGVGAVATQSFAEASYGPKLLDLLASGHDASAALASVRAADPGAELRQVGVIDAGGHAAAFTGKLCIDHAGDQQGNGYSAQANMMASQAVWPAMADAYEAADGDLAGRLVRALEAAEAAGGDGRGQMSAALLVVSGERHEQPTDGVIVDIRVDDHSEPVAELARLLDIRRGFVAYGRAVDAMFRGDVGSVLAEADAAVAVLPGNGNVQFIRAGALLNAGRVDEGVAVVHELVAEHPPWAGIIRSFVAKGMLPLPEGVDLGLPPEE